MTTAREALHGLWLPLVTPFKDGQLDGGSLRRLVAHYAGAPVDGFILGATTGEGMTLALAELERIAALTRAEVRASGRPIAIYLGLSGSNTAKLCETLDETAAWPIDGYLISTPHYVRPSQRGLLRHFTTLADRAAHPLMIYNIPYRTGVNLGNDAMLQLARHTNIVGLKDCCAVREQSIELLRQRPEGFAILTGEDAQYFDALADGADGAILASAHLETETFAAIRTLLLAGNRDDAHALWRMVAPLTQLLFAEPSPAPLKHWLWRTGLIDSAEVRLPMVEVGAELARRLDREIGRRRAGSILHPAM
ncbi:MAG: 4-hydroxy-tetrahydrodipicolinate synthase [Proteobacteria bacterium]|nr:4-hydroxy-tetrahydrodipicolinate synthase [Pseudomonadota bacterium]